MCHGGRHGHKQSLVAVGEAEGSYLEQKQEANVCVGGGVK